MASVEIYTRSDSEQPLAALLAGNLDFNEVKVRNEVLFVKSVISFDIVVKATETFLFAKFVLEPLIGPYADKWKEAAKRYLFELTPFCLEVHIRDENLVIEAPLGRKHQFVPEVWDAVHKAIEVLKTEHLLHKVTKVRFLPSDDDKLLVVCFSEAAPHRMINLSKGKTEAVPDNVLTLLAEEADDSSEAWLRKTLAQAAEHQKRLDKLRQQNKLQSGDAFPERTLCRLPANFHQLPHEKMNSDVFPGWESGFMS